MPRRELDNVSLHYDLRGPADAPVLMFSNSLGTDFAMWAPQVEALSAHWRILRYDTRGHGGSSIGRGQAGGDTSWVAYCSIERLAQDVVELLDALHIERVHFCGLSLGGLTGQCLALTHPQRLRSLTLANTASHFAPARLWDERIAAVRERGLSSIAENIVARWLCHRSINRPGNGDVNRYPDMLSMLCATDERGYVAACAAIRDADYRADLGRIRLPTLVIGGGNDRATPMALSEQMAAAIPGARLVEIADAAHLSNLDQPAAFNAQLREFLHQVRQQ